MNTRIKKRQQWTTCDRCGLMYPMSYLVVQKGLMICTRHCFDDIQNELRPLEVQRALNSGIEQEGVDLRMVDRGFFLGQNEEIF